MTISLIILPSHDGIVLLILIEPPKLILHEIPETEMLLNNMIRASELWCNTTFVSLISSLSLSDFPFFCHPMEYFNVHPLIDGVRLCGMCL